VCTAQCAVKIWNGHYLNIVQSANIHCFRAHNRTEGTWLERGGAWTGIQLFTYDSSCHRLRRSGWVSLGSARARVTKYLSIDSNSADGGSHLYIIDMVVGEEKAAKGVLGSALKRCNGVTQVLLWSKNYCMAKGQSPCQIQWVWWNEGRKTRI